MYMGLILLAVTIIALFLIKKYFEGGVCKIEKDLSNEIAVVTGGNSGIGKQTVRKICSLGCKVILGARDTKKSQRVIEEFKDLKGPIIAYHLDLEDRSSIQQFVKNVKNQIGDKPINYLVNNAGIFGVPQKKFTKTGFEMHMGTNYFGHFYLTYLLWDALKKAGNPRIINVSSIGYRMDGKSFEIDFQNLNFQNGGYQPMKAYCRSKKAIILFTKQLQQKMNEAKINGISVSVHPGFVLTSIFERFRKDSSLNRLKDFVLSPFFSFFFKSSQQGAQTSLYALLERQDKLVGGSYYADCKQAPIRSGQCISKEAANKLWKISQDAFGIKFNL